MSAANTINKILSKGFEVAGQAQQVAGLFGVDLFNGRGARNSFTIKTDKIVAGIRSDGILRSSLGFVQIVLPSSHNLRRRFELPETLDFVNNRADTFSIPGIGMATSDIKRYGYGPNERKPYAPIYTDVNFSFISDSDGRIHKFFYLWMNSIVNHHKRYAINAEDILSDNAAPYEVEYKDDYKADIIVYVYDDTGNAVSEVTLHDAYPIFISDIQYSWNDVDSLVRVPISFTYYNWSIRNVEDGVIRPRRNITNQGGLGTLAKLVKTATAVQTLVSIRRPQSIGDIINVVNNTKNVVSNLPF